LFNLTVILLLKQQNLLTHVRAYLLTYTLTLQTDGRTTYECFAP